MFYREAGQFKTTYAADQAIFPLREDRIGLALILVAAFVLIPLFGSAFFLSSVMIPFLVYALAAIGLNILTGYCGLLSLGTGAFMGVGAYACYKLTTLFPGVNIIIWIVASGASPAPSACCSACPACASKASISPWRRWRRSFSWSGVSFG